MSILDLPALNALLNSAGFVFLIIGYKNIKKGEKEIHKKFMFFALISSALFLVSYLIYHYNAGSVPYPEHWSKVFYLIILIPHIILAALQAPFIIIAVIFALLGKFEKHKKLARWVLPVWLFVSVSGVTIYVMLYWIAPMLI